MEKQSYELITGLARYAEVVTVVYSGQMNKLRWFLGLKKEVKQVLADHPDIDVIHLNDGLMATVCTWLKSYTDIPISVTLHGLDITYPWPPYRKIVVPRLQQLDNVIAVSTATRQVCLDLGFEAERVVTVVNGVDHDLHAMPIPDNMEARLSTMMGSDMTDKRLLVTLGRAVKRKGFSWFATQVMPRLGDDVVLGLIGPYEAKPSTTTKILRWLPAGFRHNVELLLGHMSDSPAVVAAAEQDDRIVQLGKLPFDELMGTLALADIFVMPNIDVPGDAEGFGLVALEASLRQTAVLAADLEGITSAIHDGGNGELIQPEDPQAWADAINTALSLNDLDSVGEAGAVYTMQHFGWEKMVDGYYEVFEDLVSR
jgi:phosphatidylinositol alpha-1,6-mannosyltransferase